VPELLEWVGLSGHFDALPHTLSGGQQQRVAIARAVIGRPQLLLADEPTGNVDDGVAVRLLYLFEELHKMGTTVLIATHNRALVERFTHPCLNVDGGRVTRVRGPGSRRSAPRPVGAATIGTAPSQHRHGG
jgi:cell division transport system ATP-binding protein